MNSNCISRDDLPIPQERIVLTTPQKQFAAPDECPTWEEHIQLEEQCRIAKVISDLQSALAAERGKRFALELDLEKLKKQPLNDYDTTRANLVQENEMLKGSLDRMNQNAKKHTVIARERSAKLRKLEGEVRSLKRDAKYRAAFEREMKSNSQKCAAEINTLTKDVKKHVAKIEDLKQNIYNFRCLFMNEVENGRKEWFLNDVNEPDSLGMLSHPTRFLSTFHFLGPLIQYKSRLQRRRNRFRRRGPSTCRRSKGWSSAKHNNPIFSLGHEENANYVQRDPATP